MIWNSYLKSRFNSPVGTVTIADKTDFPDKKGYTYKLVKLVNKHPDDDDVKEGAYYVVRWPDDAAVNKIEAPNPPFGDGETVD